LARVFDRLFSFNPILVFGPNTEISGDRLLMQDSKTKINQLVATSFRGAGAYMARRKWSELHML
jgi:hypothetical protein